MAVLNIYTINAQIIAEKSAGATRTDYVQDPIGSVVGTSNSSDSANRAYRYTPFGSILSSSGSGPVPVFRWLGSWAHRECLGGTQVCWNSTHYFLSVASFTSPSDSKALPLIRDGGSDYAYRYVLGIPFRSPPEMIKRDPYPYAGIPGVGPKPIGLDPPTDPTCNCEGAPSVVVTEGPEDDIYLTPLPGGIISVRLYCSIVAVATVKCMPGGDWMWCGIPQWKRGTDSFHKDRIDGYDGDIFWACIPTTIDDPRFLPNRRVELFGRDLPGFMTRDKSYTNCRDEPNEKRVRANRYDLSDFPLKNEKVFTTCCDCSKERSWAQKKGMCRESKVWQKATLNPLEAKRRCIKLS